VRLPNKKLKIIRASLPEHWSEIREICCLTGDGGEPISKLSLRAPLFGEYWIGPYQSLLPQWTWIAIDEAAPSGQRVAGYLTGCPDTQKFGRQKWLLSAPLLCLKIWGIRAYRQSPDALRFTKRLLKLMKTPEELIPEDIHNELLRNFPAHLHTNLRRSYRGQGVGRELIEAFLSALSSQGVAGVHLHCGSGPIPFYEKCGFKETTRVELKPGVFTYALSRKTS
jgi:hypothetical protein